MDKEEDLEDVKSDMMKHMNEDGNFELGKVRLSDIMIMLNKKVSDDMKALSGQELDIADIYHLGNDGNIIVLAGVFVLTILMIAVIHRALITEDRPKPVRVADVVETEDREPPRDFTIEQLREFNGTTNKKIYVALKGEVYDVSSSSEYYGPGSTYDCFAGRDASRAMAKLSFEESELSNPNIDDLGPFERDVLENWVEKFQYMKCYPVVGKLSYPARDRVFTPAELWECRGYRDCAAPTKEGDTTEEDIPAHHGEKAHSAAAVTSAVEAVNPPEGRVHAEILICVKGKVLDVSYGGVEMYGPGGPYQKFAGLNISRALAKMSFAPEDLSSSDISDLTAEQLKILNDWEEKFEVKKKYPVVGHMAGAAVDIDGLNE